jgi:hypothetical protein
VVIPTSGSEVDVSINRDTVVDYATVADERATATGRPVPRRARSFVWLVLIMVAIELTLLAIALIVQAGGSGS